jgi:transposase InsO family protein
VSLSIPIQENLKTHPLKKPRLPPFTLRCKELKIKHKLNRPASSTQNGKVERSHRTDDEQFYRLYKTSNFEYFLKKRKKYDKFTITIGHI